MRKYLKEKFLRNKLRKFEEKNFASRTKKIGKNFLHQKQKILPIKKLHQKTKRSLGKFF